MALARIPKPLLPAPPSWFPGHMMKFTKQLPAFLTRTDVVLEIRDSRLPLTSINRTLEGALRKWRLERGWDPNNPRNRLFAGQACEHIVVLNKRDLVPKWGTEPFTKAMAKKFPHQQMLFTSWHRPKDIKILNDILVNIAKQFPHALELNVLVIGMPNVGKSTLLNTLRHMGIKGATAKAFQTSANPGMTQALSTRLKLSLDPPIYAYDSPGVMLPYLGRGEEGAERGVKLALIAGIKEGLYDMEALASYLLYRLNVLNPIAPAYLSLLPPGSHPTYDIEDFLTQFGKRMGMLKRRGEIDISRAAVTFVRWWRDEGGLLAAKQAAQVSALSSEAHVEGWGFDFQWECGKDELEARKANPDEWVQAKMEKCIEEHLEQEQREEAEEKLVSPTQIKKKMVMEEKMKRKMRYSKK
ncbi:P-loop containing nucleoside triphosphate hydrolase protein [Coprinopsis sp. MPI-PUGE-AT-0042]|nr:P-loop containing nucleoside triphosphate hydrolase protein [Coprinopsis sp. MPI-PUGE-AT-0042]